MTFKPLWGLTIATALSLAVLIGLGFWQLNRLEWKLGLIETVENRLVSDPQPLGDVLRRFDTDQDLVYRRVSVRGRFDYDHEFPLFTPEEGGGYDIVTPFLATDGSAVLIDRGYVPRPLKEPAAREGSQPEGELTVTGTLWFPRAKGAFTPENDRDSNIWYWYDFDGMAELAGIGTLPHFVIDADQGPGEWPKSTESHVTFRNDHLGYALTWFGLALGLVGVYLYFHIANGRLRLSGGQ